MRLSAILSRPLLSFFLQVTAVMCYLDIHFFLQLMIAAFGSLHASTPYLGGALGGIILMWIQAANSLSEQFKQKSEEMERETEAEKKEL